MLSVSARGSASPRAISRRFGQRRRRAASHGAALPLRPHASLLHKAAFAKLSAVATLKLRLVPPAAARPRGFANRPYAKWPTLGSGRVSRQRSPVATRPRAGACAPWCLFGGGLSGQALRAVCLVSGLRPVMGVVLPRPPAGPRRCAALAHAPAAHPPPRGLPQSGAGAGIAPVGAAYFWLTRAGRQKNREIKKSPDMSGLLVFF